MLDNLNDTERTLRAELVQAVAEGDLDHAASVLARRAALPLLRLGQFLKQAQEAEQLTATYLGLRQSLERKRTLRKFARFQQFS